MNVEKITVKINLKINGQKIFENEVQKIFEF